MARDQVLYEVFSPVKSGANLPVLAVVRDLFLEDYDVNNAEQYVRIPHDNLDGQPIVRGMVLQGTASISAKTGLEAKPAHLRVVPGLRAKEEELPPAQRLETREESRAWLGSIPGYVHDGPAPDPQKPKVDQRDWS